VATKRIPPSRVAAWSDRKLVEEWDELRAQCARCGWKSEGDLPPTYRWNYHVMMVEVELRFSQLRLF